MTEERIGRVYVVQNRVNKKLYVGFTIKPVHERWAHHVKGGGTAAKLLHADIVKFGVENFVIKVAFEGPCSEALGKEKELIEQLGTMCPEGYNQVPGGHPFFLGRKHSKTFRANMSKRMKGNTNTLGYTHSQATKEKMSKSNKKVVHTPEWNKRVSEALLLNNPMRGRFKEKNPFYGKTHNEETRAKMRAAWERRRLTLPKRKA